MANLAKWAAGAFASGAWGTSAQSGFSSADLAFFNTAASGSGVVASSAVANSTNLDLYGEVSFAFTTSAATSGSVWVDIYLLPLNQDATTYGDGTASGALKSTAPGQSYVVARVNVPAGVTAVTGTSRPFALPRGDFKLAFFPSAGTLAGSPAVTISLRTTVENLNG